MFLLVPKPRDKQMLGWVSGGRVCVCIRPRGAHLTASLVSAVGWRRAGGRRGPGGDLLPEPALAPHGQVLPTGGPRALHGVHSGARGGRRQRWRQGLPRR